MMLNRVGPTEGNRSEVRATMRTWHLMTQGYRKSYWKTVLAAAVLTLVCGLLAAVWATMGKIAAPGFGLSRQHDPLAFWSVVTVVSGGVMAGAAVVSGGVICLYREWRQYR